MTKKNLRDRETRAELAGGRASVYELLVGVFGCLPDEAFLMRIGGEGVQSFLDSCSTIEGKGFKPGVEHIHHYLSLIKGRPRHEVLEELSVDRTGMLRGTGHRDLRPPYEGLYTPKKNAGDILLEIKRSYRRAGLMPDDSINESPDFLCLELDFMKQLCLRERDEWLSQKETRETVSHQEAFLREHLGSWVGQFCGESAKHARTDFFRGFSLILQAFISKETSYLSER